jgi:hypothetical protein
VESRPNQNEYSPLWDVHAAVWTDSAIAGGRRVLQDDFDDIEKLAEKGGHHRPRRLLRRDRRDRQLTGTVATASVG